MRISDWSSDVCSSDRHGRIGLLYALTFHDEHRINQVLRSQHIFAHQTAGKLVATITPRTRGGKVRGKNKRSHGTTLGEIQFSICAAAVCRRMRRVAENGSSEERRVGEEGVRTCRYR